MFTLRTLAAPLVLVAAALPLLVATPVQADTTDSGCTVSPKKPRFDGFDLGGNKQALYRITVTCDAGLVAEVHQVRMESDTLAREGETGEDTTGESTRTFDFTGGAGTQTWDLVRRVPNTGPASEGEVEEIYQKVEFNVTSGPVTSDDTPFELTDARSISHT